MAITLDSQQSFGERLDITYNPTGVNFQCRVIFDTLGSRMEIVGAPEPNGRREGLMRIKYVFPPYSELTGPQITRLTAIIEGMLQIITGEAPV